MNFADWVRSEVIPVVVKVNQSIFEQSFTFTDVIAIFFLGQKIIFLIILQDTNIKCWYYF